MDASFRGIPTPPLLMAVALVLFVIGAVWVRSLASGERPYPSSRALAPMPRDLLAIAGVVAVIVLMLTVVALAIGQPDR